jgi:hypothetical protein
MQGYFLGRNIVFAKKVSPEHFTPDQYRKQFELLERNFNQAVIFILPDMESFNRNRLVQKQINFIINQKQIFIPGFLVDLKEYALKPDRKTYLQPAAQCLILYHLQKQPLNHYTYKQLAIILNYPYLTITRAVDTIRALELCKVKGTKEKTICFEITKSKLWEKALPSLRSPIQKKVFIDDEINPNLLYKSNINALSYYTELNDEPRLHFAIHQDLFRKLHSEGIITSYSDYDGKYSIESWKYAPATLANKEFVDPLSLYLEFKDNKDERVQLALKQIIEQQKW